MDCLHINPFFDTCEYDIDFTYGTWNKYAANLIAENIYAQVDEEGYLYQLLAETQDNQKYRMEISKEEGRIRSTNGS